MAFTIGGAVGQVWGGFALDRFGMLSLLGGALVLGVLSISLLVSSHPRAVQEQRT